MVPLHSGTSLHYHLVSRTLQLFPDESLVLNYAMPQLDYRCPCAPNCHSIGTLTRGGLVTIQTDGMQTTTAAMANWRVAHK